MLISRLASSCMQLPNPGEFKKVFDFSQTADTRFTM